MVDLNVAAVTVIGQKHRQRGVPCEDASVAVTSNGVSAVVVADGAGSKQYTHARFGSAAAVNTIAKLLTEHFDALYNENREAAVRSLIIAALHVKFADLIVEHKIDSIERLSCTLLFCAVKDRRMIIGHIGDGLIVAEGSPDGPKYVISKGYPLWVGGKQVSNVYLSNEDEGWSFDPSTSTLTLNNANITGMYS